MFKWNQESESVLVRVGDTVPDFTLATYEPRNKDFGQFDLAKQRAAGRWSVMFFYPADYTFV